MKLTKCNKAIFVLIILLGLIPWGAATADVQQDATFFIHNEDGLALVNRPGLPLHGGGFDLRSPSIVWSNYLTDAIYQTTSNTVSGYVFAGTYLNPPKEAQLFSLSGGGNPDWGYAGTAFYTAAGDTSFTLAAVDNAAAGIDIHKWTGPGTGIPDWSTSFAGLAAGGDGPIAVSDDGSTIAVLAAPSGGDAHLLLFDADSATPLIDYPATGLGFARYVKINYDGRYIAFIALATLVIFDRDSLNVRSQIAMGFSNSAMDISGDGDLIAFGWPTLQVRQWDGSSYQSLWTWSPGGMYVNRIAISNDGNTIVSCWYNTSFTTVKIAVHDKSSATPLWTYDYTPSNGTYQEIAGDVDVTDDGRYFIVGSWGDVNNLNPEIHIFQRDTVPHVYYTVDMPGSMFSVDICNNGQYATGCGKHIHGNAMGRGGDIVMINNDLIAVSENEAAAEPEEGLLISAYPNPFRDRTIIRCMIPDGGYATSAKGNATLKIFEVSGRTIRDLSAELASCILDREPAVAWSGTDDAGRPVPSGVYFVRFATDESCVTGRLVLVR